MPCAYDRFSFQDLSALWSTNHSLILSQLMRPSAKVLPGGKTDSAIATEFVQGLGLLDSTMLVAGSMIGSGVFIVSADIGRQVGSTGWLLMAWVVTGLL